MISEKPGKGRCLRRQGLSPCPWVLLHSPHHTCAQTAPFTRGCFVKNWAERTSPSSSLRLQHPASQPLTAFRDVDPGHSETPSPLSFYSTVSCLRQKLPPCSLEPSGQRLSLIHVYLAGVSQKAPDKFNSITQPPVLKVSWGKSKEIYIACL